MTATDVVTAPSHEPASGHLEGRTAPPWLRKLGSRFLNVYAGLGLVYLFVPIFVILAFSFNDPKGKFNIVWQGFTLDNWAHPFAEPELVDALVLSLEVAAIATAIAVVLGGLVALALTRYRFRGGALVNLLLVLPLTTPEIVLGASLASLFLRVDVNLGFVDFDQTRGFHTILIAHVMFLVSFTALTIKARLRGFDWTLEDAAMDLGAGPVRTFTRVTFPLMIPGILAASLLSLALSLDDFVITLFNAGGEVTYPLYIFGATQRAIPPQIQVLATMVLVVSIVLLAVGPVFRRRTSRFG